MRGLDSDSIFKYNPHKQRVQYAAEPYLQRNVTVFQFNPSTGANINQGSFVLSLSPTQSGVKFLITKAGAVPLLEFILTKNINWNLQGNNAYFTDTNGKNWTLQFCDAESAAKTTAQIGLLLTCTTVKQISTYEYPAQSGLPPISIGDTVKMSYYAFSITSFPRIDLLFASDTDLKAIVNGQVLATGLAQGMVGMTKGNSRSIFIPQNMLVTETGYRDPSAPNTPAVFVVTINNIKYLDESKSQKHHHAAQQHNIQEPQQAQQAPQQVQQQPVQQETQQQQQEEQQEETPTQEIEENQEKADETEQDEQQQTDTQEEAKNDASDVQAQESNEEKSNNDNETDQTDKSDIDKSDAKESTAQEEEPEQDSFAAKIAKFKKIGAVASPFATMGVSYTLVKKKKQEEEERRRREEEAKQQKEESETDQKDDTDSQATPSQTTEKAPPVEKKSVPSTPEKKETIERKESSKQINPPSETKKSAPPSPARSIPVPSPDKRTNAPVVDAPAQNTPAPAPQVAIKLENMQINPQLIPNIETNLTNKIDGLTHSPIESPEAVARGVASLAAQLKVSDNNIANLKKQIEEKKQKSNSGGIMQRQLETARAEIETLKKKIADDEAKLKNIEEEIQKLTKENARLKEEANKQESKQKPKKQPPNVNKANDKATQIIKNMMQSVFGQMNSEFEEDKTYKGQVVIDSLFSLLQKQSYDAMKVVDEGLL